MYIWLFMYILVNLCMWDYLCLYAHLYVKAYNYEKKCLFIFVGQCRQSIDIGLSMFVGMPVYVCWPVSLSMWVGQSMSVGLYMYVVISITIAYSYVCRLINIKYSINICLCSPVLSIEFTTSFCWCVHREILAEMDHLVNLWVCFVDNIKF